MKNRKYIYDIVIIGAGFAGAYAALELAKDGHKILLLESSTKVVGPYSTSFNQCYKLHSGVHYFGDALTAGKCLYDSIICAKQWPDFLLGKPNSAPRRNRHYVMSNSLFDVTEARKVASMLKRIYFELVQKDSSNKVFGDPANFIREVTLDECPYVAKEMDFTKKGESKGTMHVALALDVGEPQIDIRKLQKHLNSLILHNDNITPVFNCEVTNIDPSKDNFGYRVIAKKKNGTGDAKVVSFNTKGIVNCSWHNIELLDKTAGISDSNPAQLLIRMKISLLAKLPPELHDMDTCIFSLGPYCSITNQFDGTAVLTYEPTTNISQYFQGEEPPPAIKNIRRILSQGKDLKLTPIGRKIAQDIINGCSIYVPKMKDAKVLEVRVGYVKIYVDQNESYSIYEKNSPIHKRREDGIVVHSGIAPCYVSASAMKMTYAQSNAEKIRGIMQKEMGMRAEWESYLNLHQNEKFGRDLHAFNRELASFLKPKLLKLASNNPGLYESLIEQNIPSKVLTDVTSVVNSELEHEKALAKYLNFATDIFSKVNLCNKDLAPTLLKDPITSKFIKPFAQNSIKRKKFDLNNKSRIPFDA